MENLPKVLIVDDREENLIALEKIIGDLDLEVIRASSGNEALSFIIEHEFCLAIIDVEMPQMDGYETVELIYGDNKNTFLPVIFVSAVCIDDHFQIKGIEKGAVDFIIKPIAPQILKGKVQVFLKLYEQRKKIEKYAEDLARSNDDLEHFAHIVSHDLLSPLRGISSCMSFIKKDYKETLDINAHNIVVAAEERAKRLHEMTVSLLNYSKLTKSKNHVETVDSEEALKVSLDNLKHKMEERNAVITNDRLPVIKYNKDLLIRLFQNLISNAIKYCDSNVEPCIHVAAVKAKNSFFFSVADNGIGIDSKFKDRIFVIFQRLHKDDKYCGTGMGLTFCKKIVERHGGQIWVESEAGEGSTFYFTVPFKV